MPKTKSHSYKKSNRLEVKNLLLITKNIISLSLFVIWVEVRTFVCLIVISDKAAVADKLLLLGQRQWKGIHKEPKSGLGYEKIPITELKVKMPPDITEEVKKVMVFRFSHKGRLVGIRERDILNLIFVDPNHNLY
ncbi:MAG: hypothetical protein H7844_15850 [Nitrospirae bacterium YQR-1]